MTRGLLLKSNRKWPVISQTLTLEEIKLSNNLHLIKSIVSQINLKTCLKVGGKKPNEAKLKKINFTCKLIESFEDK